MADRERLLIDQGRIKVMDVPVDLLGEFLLRYGAALLGSDLPADASIIGAHTNEWQYPLPGRQRVTKVEAFVVSDSFEPVDPGTILPRLKPTFVAPTRWQRIVSGMWYFALWPLAMLTRGWWMGRGKVTLRQRLGFWTLCQRYWAGERMEGRV